MIKDLIAPGILDVETRLVLVNAIHFLGQWKQAFDKENSYNGTFYGVDGQTQCRLMSKSASKEKYGTEGDYHWVTMFFHNTFSLELGVELSEILQDSPFNMKKPFSNQADFSNLFHNESVHVDKVIHKLPLRLMKQELK